MPSLENRGEDVKLANETAGKRNSYQREQEERQQCRQSGTLYREAVIVLYCLQRLFVSAHLRDDREGSNIHRSVGSCIKTGRCDARMRKRGEGSQKVTGVRNA